MDAECLAGTALGVVACLTNFGLGASEQAGAFFASGAGGGDGLDFGLIGQFSCLLAEIVDGLIRIGDGLGGP